MHSKPCKTDISLPGRVADYLLNQKLFYIRIYIKIRLEGGDQMDESGSPKQTEDYHLLSEGQSVLPGFNLVLFDQSLICQII